MSFDDLRNTQIRRIILDTLRQESSYTINESILRTILRQFGFGLSHDLLRTQLAWLAEQGLLTTGDASGVMVAKITMRGADVASGCVVVPGVARPEPEIN